MCKERLEVEKVLDAFEFDTQVIPLIQADYFR